MSTLTSDSPLSSLGNTTSDESKKKDEILSGVNWNYGQHIGTSRRLRLRLRQVQEGLIRAKQYNIVKERLDLLLSVMSARKALGNPLSPQEIPTDLYNIIFHPQNIWDQWGFNRDKYLFLVCFLLVCCFIQWKEFRSFNQMTGKEKRTLLWLPREVLRLWLVNLMSFDLKLALVSLLESL